MTVEVYEDGISISASAGSPFPYTVSGDLRTPGSDMDEDNHDYEERIKHLLGVRADLGSPAGPIQFDSEYSCFFAYCRTREDAESIAYFAREVSGTLPPSIHLPGDVGRWVKLDDYQDAVPVGSVGVIVNAFRDPELHEDDEDRGSPGYEDDRPDVWEVFVPALQQELRLSTNGGGGQTVRVPAGSQVILREVRDGAR